MATDTRRMEDPQFTHGRLLEAATLLRLPVDLLADRLGLAPDVTGCSVSPEDLPMPSYESHEPDSSWVDVSCHGSDEAPRPSLANSLPNPDLSAAQHPIRPSMFATTTSHIPGPGFGSNLALSSAWYSGSGPSTPSRWPERQVPYQHYDWGQNSIVGRPSGNYLTVPTQRSGTPASLTSQGAATDVSSQIAPSLCSQPTSLATLSDIYLKVEGSPVQEIHDEPEVSGGPDVPDDEFSVTKEEAEAAIINAPTLGPCSKVWVLPPRIQRKKKARSDDTNPAKRKRDSADSPKQGHKRRSAYTDEAKKKNTALTRLLKSCIRCRMNRGRCHPDPDDLTGPCLTCKSMTGPTLCKMPCYRYIITDVLLYREQKAPFQVYSKRWQSMDIINIPASDWASDEIRTIEVSPNHHFAPFRFRVRQFIPVEGDLLEEQWMTATGPKTIPLPKYAVADMHEAARDLKDFIETNISNFIDAAVKDLDPFFFSTYLKAFRHIGTAKTEKEKSLLANTFRLWVTCRFISHPVHICSEEKLGGHAVYSPDSLHNGKVPMPVIMTAQFECINYTNFLRPWSKAILKQLNDLVLDKKREYWLTIYFTMFILLHSCAMLTRRDEETARQYNLKEQYANPETIRAHQSGMQTMLAHFHFINKGVAPFGLAHTAVGRQQLAKAAELDDEQVQFVWETSTRIQEPRLAARIKKAREEGRVGDDLYWVSMLFDKEWKPVPQD